MVSALDRQNATLMRDSIMANAVNGTSGWINSWQLRTSVREGETIEQQLEE